MSELLEHQILDFSGGLNDTLNNLLVKDSEASSLSNVFVNQGGGVEKRYGYVVSANDPFSSSTKSLFAYRSVAAITADVLLASDSTDIQKLTGSVASGTWSYIGYTGAGDTCQFTNGSITINSNGAPGWLTQVAVGDQIRDETLGGSWVTISAVNSNTQIEISSAYAGTTNAVASYTIRQKLQPAFGPASAVMFKDKLYVGPASSPASGSSGLMSYNGTQTSRVASSTVFNTMAVHKNYVFGFNNKNSTNPSRLYWGALLDPETYPASNFVDVSPNDGDVLRGIISHNDVLYIFKDTSIWYLVGDVFDPSNPTYALRRVINPSQVGTFHGRTLKVYNGAVTFLGKDGVYALDGVSMVKNISRGKIDTTIKTVKNRAVPAAVGTFGTACAEVYDNKYWLSVQTLDASTDNDRTLVLDDRGAWTKHTIGVTDFILQRISGNPGVQLTGAVGATTDILMIDGTATNDGASATTSSWTSKIITFGDFSQTTQVVDMYIAYQNTTNQAATIAVYDDSGQIGSGNAHTFPGGSSQFITVQRIPIERDTNQFWFTVSDATASKSFRLVAVMLTYRKQSRGSGKVVT